jgi:hypothetical protein
MINSIIPYVKVVLAFVVCFGYIIGFNNYCLKNHKGSYKEGSWLYEIHHQSEPDWRFLNGIVSNRTF